MSEVGERPTTAECRLVRLASPALPGQFVQGDPINVTATVSGSIMRIRAAAYMNYSANALYPSDGRRSDRHRPCASSPTIHP
jgi:hypothetical protein